ncbi:aminodeoxychorismate lyase [Paenibacillus sp. YYML68]|uniref:aminodeoxychorismate lyase n=1 Tax=Paenibacillus sp. YYML68 TaxID=2909250 RepID=UPI002493459A|nr:aminodeoxychorismate lyase [Paenibacillus sp. YYML68]
MILDWNGTLIEDGEAVVSFYDHGFLYGIGLFETFRTYGGRPFLLEWHIERLFAGCQELGIVLEPEETRLRSRIQALLVANQLEDAYIRWTVTAGEEALGLPAGDYVKPTDMIYIKPLPAATAVTSSTGRAGKSLQLLKQRRSTPEGAIRLKSLHYMNNIVAKRELSGYPWAMGAEGLFLDVQGHLCEGIVSNVFFVRDGVVHTPAVETGLLPGITRRFVLETAEQLGLEVQEGRYRWEQLLQADEVFLTNSIQEMVPVARLYDTDGAVASVGGDGQGAAGPITEQLQQRYRRATALTAQQQEEN